MKKLNVTKDLFESEVHSYITNKESLELIEKAYNCAYRVHQGQMRKSGEPYFVHLLNVAYILATLKSDPKTIAAGLLHDSVEDTGVTKEDLALLFDEEIANLVESVTKIKQLKFNDESEYLASNHRKIFIAMAKDVRVIIIKLVDRLHNMRTLEWHTPEKQKKIAGETLDVYAPIAHRLGINEIKNELEDLSFYYLKPDNYREVANLLEKKKTERDEHVQKMIGEIEELLTKNNIQYRIFGRSKHLYSIYKKMTYKHKRFEEILDLQAIRIVTKSELNCYEVLGHIHANYKPIPGRFKDYIAVPKMNMYQSLHTTIVGYEGDIYEVQIRTEEMDKVAEKGIAAHWRYKEGLNNNALNQKEIEEKLSLFRDINLMTAELDNPVEYMDMLQKDIFEANIYVMSPKGRVINLPNGATPLDFAYRIHTDVGHATVGAIVNNVLVPLNTPLKTGDVVQIRTSKQNPAPSEGWLKIVKTSHARNKIKTYFLKKEQENRAEMISKGEQIFKDELKKRNLEEKEFLDKTKLDNIYSYFSVSNYSDLMYAIGMKSLNSSAVVDKMTTKRNVLDNIANLFVSSKNKNLSKSKSGVKVAGIETMMIGISNCCLPLPGDEIVGYITKGAGVKVHRVGCPNIANSGRLIDVSWDEVILRPSYEAKIQIESKDRNFLLSDLITVVAQCQSNMVAVNSKVNNETLTAITTMTLMVKDLEHLRNVIANLRKVDSVLKIERIIN
ncbi:MAG: bifunctional (p)ppGpp synthetase/guanosine-3',5'-bis(diphosphate) 3'-pyrophosphohydrolase [Erysipelotrichaceae bacterium]